MNKRIMVGAGLVVAAALCLPFGAGAASTPNTGSHTSAGAGDTTVRGVIDTIDIKAKTIEIKVTEGTGLGKKKTLDVPSNTKIEKNNKINLHVKDLQEGDEVSLTYKRVDELDAKTKKMAPVLKTVKITVLASKEGSDTNAVPKALSAPKTPTAPATPKAPAAPATPSAPTTTKP